MQPVFPSSRCLLTIKTTRTGERLDASRSVHQGGGSDGQDRIQVRTYSPSLDQFATDSSSQFSFDLDFTARFTPL